MIPRITRDTHPNELQTSKGLQRDGREWWSNIGMACTDIKMEKSLSGKMINRECKGMRLRNWEMTRAQFSDQGSGRPEFCLVAPRKHAQHGTQWHRRKVASAEGEVHYGVAGYG